MLKNGRTTFPSGAFEPRSKSNSGIREHRGSNSVSFGSKRRRFGLREKTRSGPGRRPKIEIPIGRGSRVAHSNRVEKVKRKSRGRFSKSGLLRVETELKRSPREDTFRTGEAPARQTGRIRPPRKHPYGIIG